MTDQEAPDREREDPAVPGRFEGAAYQVVRGQGGRALVFPADEVDAVDQVELGTSVLEGFIDLAGSRRELAILTVETGAGSEVRPMAYQPESDGPPVRLVLQLERHRLSVNADGTIVARPPLGPEDLGMVERWLDRAQAVG